MDSWKAEVRRVRRDKIRRKKMQMREKVGKSRNTVFFQWFVAPVGRKAAGAEPAGQMRDEKLHAVVVRSTFPSQNVQNTPGSDHFWRFRCRKSVEKVHAVVARSTFRSQKCKKLRVLSLFWREDVEKVDTD